MAKILEETLGALGELDDALNADLDEGSPSLDIILDESGEPSGVIESTEVALAMARRDASDASFAAKLELRTTLQRLRPPRATLDVMVAEAEGARRKLRRVHAHVLLLLSRCGAISPTMVPSTDDDVEVAIATRRLYTDFRRSLRPPHSATLEEARKALGSAARALTRLFGSGDAKYLRVRDHTLLTDLQARIINWMWQGTVSSGHQLWSDVAATADLLRGINQRQELVDHDRRTVRSLIEKATGERQSATVARLRTLFGLDDELDRFIEHVLRDPEQLSGDELQRELVRVAAHIDA